MAKLPTAQLKPNLGVSEAYRKKLMRLVRAMTSAALKATRPYAQDSYFLDDTLENIAFKNLKTLQAKFEALFGTEAQGIAFQFAASVAKSSRASVTNAVRTAGFGLGKPLGDAALTTYIQSAAITNVNLIKSIPSEFFEKLYAAVGDSVIKGEGLKDLIPAIQELTDQTERRVKNIALDQTRKVYNTLNEKRLKGLGVKRFMWHHSGGGAKPREEHEEWDGQIFDFDDLPVDEEFGPVIPGEAINCKCTMSPVFDLDEDEKTENVDGTS